MNHQTGLSAVALAEDIGTAAHEVSGTLRVSSLVDGKRVVGESKSEERVSPLDDTLAFSSAPLNILQTEKAIQTVRRGFDGGQWGRTTGRARSKVLWRAAQLVEAASQRLEKLLMVEAGKPIREARGEVAVLVNSFEYFAGLARLIGGRTENAIDPGMLAMTLREPAGVAGLIVPWNFPLGILGQKLPPALAAGNTVVLKPSPLTPLSALAVAELLFEAGLPTDALSIVLGDAEVGATVVESMDTDVISFTGSTAVGRTIASTAGKNRLKPMAIEAGGKTPVIVLRDADLESTVDGILFSAYFNQGQVCVAGSRILAHRDIADELATMLADKAREVIVGDPREEDTELGPLISTGHFAEVTKKIQDSVDAGAQVIADNSHWRAGQSAAGPFLAPTILRTDDDSNPSVTQELFGPVTTIQTFDRVDDAVARANAQPFGLAASVWGASADELLTLTRKLRVGTVWINGSTESHPELPLGGRRDSGFAPEFGREGLDFFTVLKSVLVRTGGPVASWYGAK